MKNVKKVLLICVLIVLIVLLAMIFQYFITPSFEHANTMSKENVTEVLNKREAIDNLYAKFESEVKSGGTEDNHILYKEFFIDNNFAKMVSTLEKGEKQIYQEDKSTGEIVWISELDELIIKMNNPQMSVFAGIYGYDLSDLEDYEVFRHLGNTTLDGRECIVIFLMAKNSNVREIVYVDKETGLINKHIKKTLFRTITDVTQINTLEDKSFMIDAEMTYPNYKKVELPS